MSDLYLECYIVNANHWISVWDEMSLTLSVSIISYDKF